MRGPRLSLSEDFRDQWDKENMDPYTNEYAPRMRRQQIISALRDITEQARKERAGRKRQDGHAGRLPVGEREERLLDAISVTNKWLDELLDRT